MTKYSYNNYILRNLQPIKFILGVKTFPQNKYTLALIRVQHTVPKDIPPKTNQITSYQSHVTIVNVTTNEITSNNQSMASQKRCNSPAQKFEVERLESDSQPIRSPDPDHDENGVRCEMCGALCLDERNLYIHSMLKHGSEYACIIINHGGYIIGIGHPTGVV